MQVSKELERLVWPMVDEITMLVQDTRQLDFDRNDADRCPCKWFQMFAEKCMAIGNLVHDAEKVVHEHLQLLVDAGLHVPLYRIVDESKGILERLKFEVCVTMKGKTSGLLKMQWSNLVDLVWEDPSDAREIALQLPCFLLEREGMDSWYRQRVSDAENALYSLRIYELAKTSSDNEPAMKEQWIYLSDVKRSSKVAHNTTSNWVKKLPENKKKKAGRYWMVEKNALLALNLPNLKLE